MTEIDSVTPITKIKLKANLKAWFNIERVSLIQKRRKKLCTI